MAAKPGHRHAVKRRKLGYNDNSVTESEVEEAAVSSQFRDQQKASRLGSETESEPENEVSTLGSSIALQSLNRAISPPNEGKHSADDKEGSNLKINAALSSELKVFASPINLTKIKDLLSTSNVDTISLSDILRDPLIKECWQFNYLFDIDFIMSHLDEDARNIVQVKIVHGSWKTEDQNRLMLEEAAKRYENVQLITAYMPEPFGTHHSKMMILIRHDNCVQVVIHTANMISQDWKNMCQAVWRSPLLPLGFGTTGTIQGQIVGSGERFKTDLLRYLRFYGKRLGDLPDNLAQYDFRSIRAAFIASVPCRQDPNALGSSVTSWGWLGLRQILCQIPSRIRQGETPNVNVQISSVATIGRNDDWLQNLFSVMSITKVSLDPKNVPISAALQPPSRGRKPTFRVIFPTADTIRRSLDGYAAGGSIHWKLQSAAQQAQLAYLKPFLHHWAGDSASTSTISNGITQQALQCLDKTQIPASGHRALREAGRRRAAPHIKTYIRFSDSSQEKIDWAMLTSANLSTQAWGGLPGKKDGEVRISSWETGVILWPEAVSTDLSETKERQKTVMVPTFGRDTPPDELVKRMRETEEADIVIGLRMPYDLPLIPYAGDDEPWCATAEYEEPDWKGISWV